MSRQRGRVEREGGGEGEARSRRFMEPKRFEFEKGKSRRNLDLPPALSPLVGFSGAFCLYSFTSIASYEHFEAIAKK